MEEHCNLQLLVDKVTINQSFFIHFSFFITSECLLTAFVNVFYFPLRPDGACLQLSAV